jgi:hypothetical protein
MSTVNSGRARETTGWVGWVAFAAAILVINGIFSAIQGLMAIIGPDTYFVTTEGGTFLLNVAGWGWYHLIIGLLLVLAGLALVSGATWARVLAVVLVILSMVGQFLLIPAQPWWSVIVIAIDFLILYAIIAHGSELRDVG